MAEHTPIRNFRSPDKIWLPAKERAAERGETLTDVLNRALAEYIKPEPNPRTKATK